MQASAIIVAAGKSTRFGEGVPKQFQEICGKPLLAWTISRFEEARTIGSIVLVVAEDQLVMVGDQIVSKYGFHKVKKIVVGGSTRRDSVLSGLEGLATSSDIAAIHDGARPLVLPRDIDRVVEVASRHRAAMLAVPVVDTLKHSTNGSLIGTVDRAHLYQAQTPQVFEYELILEAHRSTLRHDNISDDAALIEESVPVRIVEPTGPNPKVTTAADLAMVTSYLRSYELA